MKIIKNSILGALIVLSLSSAVLLNHPMGTNSDTTYVESNNGFALLELFTSEGCSSCPRADELMARIQKEAIDKPVYILSYHVDYWNHLGWKDIFSSSQNTERQRKYNRWFSSQLYTPQLIINGRAEFVGSDAAGINKEIMNSVGEDVSATLTIQVQQQSADSKLHYQVSGHLQNEQLLIAIVQKHAERKIKRGENEGRTLSHVQIVRQLYSFTLAGSKQGTETIALPPDFNEQEWEVIGMLQNPATGAISAATRSNDHFSKESYND